MEERLSNAGLLLSQFFGKKKEMKGRNSGNPAKKNGKYGNLCFCFAR